MTNVLQFRPRQEAQASMPSAAADVRPMAMERPSLQPAAIAAKAVADNPGELSKQVVATLAFYAGQGWDGGAKARVILGAMAEAMDVQPPLGVA